MSTQLANATKSREDEAIEAKIDQAAPRGTDEVTAQEINFYTGEFEANKTRLSENLPAWIADLRQAAINQFAIEGFPTTREEDYKYTNVAPVAKGKFQLADASQAATLTAEDFARFTYEETKASRLVFVNGAFNAELSSIENLPHGVIAKNLNLALQTEHADLIRGYFSRGLEVGADDAFTLLNTAFMQGGAFVHLPKNAQLETPLHLLFLTDANAASIATFPRVLVIAESFSKATIIEEHKAINESCAAYFSSPVIEIFVDDEAHLTHYKVQSEAASAFHIARTRAEVGRASTYNSTTINLGATFTRHNVQMSLRGEASESWIDGLFFGEGTQFCDTHSLINHRQPHCTSHQAYKGILNDKARSVFNGRIYVHEGAQKTDAYQSNKNLILSDQARVDTKPQLEIFADDVKCSHGATVGQLNEEELFYLISRGLQPELARNLLTYGFAEQVVQKIEVESIKRQLDEAILNRLHTTLE